MRRFTPLALIIVLGIGVPLLVSALSGNLDIPHNDAWAYSRVARVFGETGRIEFVGWGQAAMIGQIVVLGPLAASLVAQHVFVALTGALFVVCVYLLLEPRIGPLRANLAAVACVIWPGFALLATSFMQDIPAAGVSFLALVLADRALARDSRLLFWLSMLASLWASTIRVQTLAAPISIAIVALWSVRKRRRLSVVHVLSGLLVFVLAFAVFTLWRDTIPDSDPIPAAVRPGALIVVARGTVQAWFTLAIVVGPFALMFSRPWKWRWRGWTAAAVAAVAGIAVLAKYGADGFFLPNYLARTGPYAAVLNPQREVYSEQLWAGVVLFALIMGVVMAGVIAEYRGPLGGVLAPFAVITLVGTLGELALQGAFDRYLIPVLPWLLYLSMAQTARERAYRTTRTETTRRSARLTVRTVGVLGVAAVGLLTVSLTANAWAFDRVRWDIATAQSATYPPARIDAGLEWLGWHSDEGVINRHPTTGRWEVALFSAAPACVVLTTNEAPAAGWSLIRTVDYKTFMVAGRSRIWVWNTHEKGCPA